MPMIVDKYEGKDLYIETKMGYTISRLWFAPIRLRSNSFLRDFNSS